MKEKQTFSMESCPLCNVSHLSEWTVKRSLNLWRCSNCSLVLLDTDKPMADFFDDIEEEFFSDGYLRRRDVFAERFLLNKARNRLKVIRRFCPEGRLLDLGTGTGELLPVAREMGYEVEGLDYSKSLVDYARTQYGITVHHGDLSSVDLPHQYDVVVMNHVIEHVTNPVETLKQIKNILIPGGVLYLATPNIDCWESAIQGWGCYEPYHLWYFSPSSIQRLINNVGLEIIETHTWEPYSAWFNTVLRTLLPKRHAEARLKIHHDIDNRRRYRFLIMMVILNTARFVSGLFLTPLRLLQERLDRGEELIILARKNESL